jgi:DNA helicase II / ATP-dependent DNA helicase PcrA
MDQPTAEEQQVIDEEQAMLAKVGEALRRSAASPDKRHKISERITVLQEAAAQASPADLPALLAQLFVLQRQAERVGRTTIPSAEVPYFAHMTLLVDDQQREVLLGFQTYIDEGVTIVDWRTAPVAKVFFNYDEGEDYEHESDGRWLSGEVLKRRVVTLVKGELTGIRTPETTLRRSDDGTWSHGERRAAPKLVDGAGRAGVERFIGTGEAGRREPVVTALLDTEQYAALTRDPDRPLLILGGAGCGKTTVALHRLADLAWRDPATFEPHRMAVIVPERGLLRLTRSILAGIGMPGVGAHTFDEWITTQGLRILRGLPRQLCPITPYAVSRFKRHPALLSVLPDLLEQLAVDLARHLDRELWTDDQVLQIFTEPSARGITLRARMNRAERRLNKSGAKVHKPVSALFRRERRKLDRMVGDRQRLLLDRALLMKAVELSDGELDAGMVDAVVAHTAAQVSTTTEEAFEDVDPERLATLDRRAIDDGTPTEAAGTIDAEDYALLFELLRLKTGSMKTGKNKFPRYTHLVVDEAQDLAPVELTVLGNALRDDGSVTVAGDQAQQIDPSVVFTGWDAVLGYLGVERSSPIELRTSYRCPGPIASFGHHVLGHLAPADPPQAAREGADVVQAHFPNEGLAAIFLTEALADLMQREPHAGVAVVARTPDSARRVHGALTQSLRATLVLEGEFEFGPGIHVSDVSQVKGLEFDYVVLPDVSSNHYPDQDESRRALHVASTRAVYQLCVLSSGKRSGLLPET